MWRSGHHAVVGWLQDQYIRSGATIEHHNNVCNAHLNYPLLQPDPSPKQILARSHASDVLVLNYEDLPYNKSGISPVYTALSTTPDRDTRDVIILRDWYNVAASRLKYLKAIKVAEGYAISKIDTSGPCSPVNARVLCPHRTRRVLHRQRPPDIGTQYRDNFVSGMRDRPARLASRPHWAGLVFGTKRYALSNAFARLPKLVL